MNVLLAQTDGGWVSIVGGIVTLAITAFLIPYLKQKAASAKEEARKHSAEADELELGNMGMLKDKAKYMALDLAANIAEKKFPQLAARIQAGEFSSEGKTEKIKKELYSWGRELKDSLIKHFDGQGIDIVVALGDKYLDSLIETVANKVSPFQGRDTARTLLVDNNQKVLKWLMEKGVKWVKTKFDREDDTSTE